MVNANMADDLKTKLKARIQPAVNTIAGPVKDSSAAGVVLHDAQGAQINHASPGEQQMLNEGIPLQLYDQVGQETAAANGHLSGPELRNLVIAKTRERFLQLQQQQMMQQQAQGQQPK